MKNTDIYRAFSYIDPVLIAEAVEKAPEIKRAARARLLRIGTVAACIALVAVIVPVTLLFRREPPAPPADVHTDAPFTDTHAPGTGAPDTDASGTDTPGTDTPGTVVPEPEFVIENGVLWNYNGDDTDVVIPDDVIEVAGTAFENSPQVESVTLGKNTEYVAPETFLCLMALKNIYVPEENKSYKSVDGKTIESTEDIPNFESINSYSQRLPDYDWSVHYSYVFENYIEELMAKRIRIARIVKFTVGDAVFEAELTPWSGKNDIELKAVTVHGRRIDFDRFREMYGDEYGDAYFNVYGNRYFQAFWAGDVFVISSLFYNTGFRLLITEDDIFVCTDEDGYDNIPESCRLFPGSYSSYTFYEKDGALHYERIPLKFSARYCYAVGQKIQHCVSRNELYQETGLVIIEGDTVRTVPETKVTIDEAIDLEQEYIDWCGNVGSSVGLDPEKISLDEFLAGNGPDAPWYCWGGSEEDFLFQKEE